MSHAESFYVPIRVSAGPLDSGPTLLADPRRMQSHSEFHDHPTSLKFKSHQLGVRVTGPFEAVRVTGTQRGADSRPAIDSEARSLEIK